MIAYLSIQALPKPPSVNKHE